MAHSSHLFDIALANVPIPGTSVAPSVPIFDNTTNVLITNTGANGGLVGLGVPGIPLVAGVNGFPVPSGANLSIPIGTQSQRGTVDQTSVPGSGIIYDSEPGGTSFVMMYLNTPLSTD